MHIPQARAPRLPRSIMPRRRPRQATSEIPEPPREPAPTLGEAEAARYIGMSAGWLKKSRTARFRSEIDGPPFIRCGARRVVYRRVDLDAWLARHQEVGGPATITESSETNRVEVPEVCRPCESHAL